MKSNIFNTSLTVSAVFFVLTFCGCRQRDIKETSVRVPAAVTTDVQAKITSAVTSLDGVEKDTIVYNDGVLTLKYDSMKLGIKNIEHAIMDAGFDANDFKGRERNR